jgi:3-hydroxybutyryl-CoA dehydratase
VTFFEEILGYSIEEINEGDIATFAKTITETDIYLFAATTCDFNPAHVNQVYAEGTYFKKRIAHGMLTTSLISNILGTILPGPGTIFVSQSVKFLAPVYIGDTISAEIEMIELNKEKNRAKFSCKCTNQNNIVVLEGEGTVMPPKKKKK